MKQSPHATGVGRKPIWSALAGIALFVALGIAVLPGLVERRPGSTPAPVSRVALEQVDAEITEQAFTADPEAAPLPDPVPGASDRVFDCMIVPSEVVDIGSAITGVVDELHAERSHYVEAGQMLARLEASVEEAAVASAAAVAERTVDIESGETSLELGEIRRARARKLFESNALSLDTRQEVEAEAKLAALELERAREDHRLASLRLAQAKAALERRTIRSPTSGFVVERLMGRGEVVVEEDTIFRIARVDPLRVEAILPSSWFGRVRAGGSAEIVPEPPLDQARTAEVEIVDAVIDGASGTFGVRLELPNPDLDLPAGLRCQLRFLESDPEAASAEAESGSS